MGHRHRTFSEPFQRSLVEDIVDQAQALVRRDGPIPVHRDATSFLTTVLQGVQGVVRLVRHIPLGGKPHAEYPALLVEFRHD
jgi:hypothetical protein